MKIGEIFKSNRTGVLSVIESHLIDENTSQGSIVIRFLNGLLYRKTRTFTTEDFSILFDKVWPIPNPLDKLADID